MLLNHYALLYGWSLGIHFVWSEIVIYGLIGFGMYYGDLGIDPPRWVFAILLFLSIWYPLMRLPLLRRLETIVYGSPNWVEYTDLRYHGLILMNSLVASALLGGMVYAVQWLWATWL